MEGPERKRWDPNCPRCRGELERHVELWRTVSDELDHGVVKGALFNFEDYFCTHETQQETSKSTAPPSEQSPDFPMSIRLATERDLERILEIERLSFEKQWDHDKFKTALNDVFLVFEEKEILGFLSACCCAVARSAIIMKIAVHPDHRGKGIATRLIEEALEKLRKMGIEEVELHVEIIKRGAIQLYEKFGFKTRKVVTVNYEEDEAFYEMRLKLNAA